MHAVRRAVGEDDTRADPAPLDDDGY